MTVSICSDRRSEQIETVIENTPRSVYG